MEAGSRPIRVVLADDHPLVREGLMRMLEACEGIEVVAEAQDGAQLMGLVAKHLPDVVLMDIRMPEVDGIEAVRRIRSQFPQVKALMLTVHDEDAYVKAALSAGAKGYLLKTVSARELAEGIRLVAEGKAALTPAVARTLIEDLSETNSRRERPIAELSKRERDVLQLLAYGKSNKEIAKTLGIGAQTVKTHVSHIFAKLGALDRTGAVAIALRTGLVE